MDGDSNGRTALTTARIQAPRGATAYTFAPMRRTLIKFLILFPAFAAIPAWAQTTVIQTENVRTEYAQVLHAEPVYQTLRATNMVERCEQSTPVVAGDEPRRGLSRVVGAVKDVLTPSADKPASGDQVGVVEGVEKCRMVPVEREYRRPIAYDVDYVHKGVKYRSRLPYDPGNRLRVRVSVTPVVPSASTR
jgi:uncharacterized protein YcfJ